MSDDLVSAGELRAMGIPVPDTIPDCATTKRSAIRMHVGPTTGDPGARTVNVRVDVAFDAPFEWIEMKVELGGDDDAKA